MKRNIILFCFFTITIVGILIVKQWNTVPTITYFPLDDETSFDTAETFLEFSSSNTREDYDIFWYVKSISEIPMYLRQDVSLLFADGELYGMRSQWRENTDTITFTEKIQEKDNKVWESLSFHYGELHRENVINSIQKITYDKRYIIKGNNRYNVFSLHEIDKHGESIKPLDKKTNKKLIAHWQKLLFHYHLDINDYISIPLTNLHYYQNNPFPNMDQELTNRVMGQLWEGLYKNYIIPNIDSKEKITSYVPLILLEKEGNNILVLYEINGEKEKLIQRIK